MDDAGVDDLEAGRAIAAYAAAHDAEYAGMWLADGVFLVAFTQRLGHHRAGLQEVVAESAVRVVSAERTVTELEAVVSEIDALYIEGDSERSMRRGLISVGIDPRTNTVAVGVLPVALELAAEVKDRWGASVTVCHDRPGVALNTMPDAPE
jgi:hypothetical protein